MLVPPAAAGGPARGCAPAALSRAAVAPPCAPWLSGGVGARSAPTSRRARSPRGVEQGAAFWCARLKAVHVHLAVRSLHAPIDLPRAVHISSLTAAATHRSILAPPMKARRCHYPSRQRQLSFACDPISNHAGSHYSIS